MPVKNRKCAVPGCKATKGMHSMPRDPSLASRWLQFVGLDEQSGAQIRVCNAHFTEECFANGTMVQMGFQAALQLTENAVPTISVPTTGAMAGPSHYVPGVTATVS